MAAHDSQYPNEDKPKTIRVDGTGVSMNWRNIIIGLLTVLGGVGGYTGISFVTEGQLETAVAKEQKAREAADTEIRQDVVDLTVKVDSVQSVQHMDIAHREARRVVAESIQCRRNDDGCEERRAKEQERIRRLNMKRLQAEKPRAPCSDLSCR